MAKGWIKLYRQSEKNTLYFSEPFDKWHAWQDLLLMVNHEKKEVLSKGRLITLEPGQMITSAAILAERWRWSVNKVRRYFRLLVGIGMCTINGTPLGTTITVVNWAKYQGDGHTYGTTDGTADGRTDGTADGTLTRIYKNDKEGEKIPTRVESDEEILAFLKSQDEAIKNAKTEEERIKAEYGIGF